MPQKVQLDFLTSFSIRALLKQNGFPVFLQICTITLTYQPITVRNRNQHRDYLLIITAFQKKWKNLEFFKERERDYYKFADDCEVSNRFASIAFHYIICYNKT